MYKDHEFQKRTEAAYLAGEDIVLQAPPGAGKTRAALNGGLRAFGRAHEIAQTAPQRIVFATPMRTLTQAQYKLAEYHYRTNAKWEREWPPSIQTGEQPDDPMFERKLIFATVDQVLASFINLPYGLPRRLDNINAGAFIGSYLIFDEFHLYPRDEMMLSVLAMLKMLKGVSRFTLMSATFSRPFLEAIGRELDATVIAAESGVPLEQGLFRDVTNITTQERLWQVEGAGVRLDAAAVRRLRGWRTVCICNTIERARVLFESLRAELPDVDIRLLHSRFYRADRRAKEAELIEKDETGRYSRFEGTEREVILVATQVIEVGIDISCDVLLSECAPAASLIQRAGRCARREHERGRVYVFQPLDDDKKINWMPYGGAKKGETDDGQLALCERTWDALASSKFNGQVLRFPEEQALIDATHGEFDAQLIDNLGQKIDTRIGELLECMASRDDGYIRKLIRSVDSVPLFIDPAPNGDKLLTERPFEREPLSVSRGQIYHALKAVPSDAERVEWFGCTGEDLNDKDDDSQSDAKYKWDSIKPEEVFNPRWRWFCATPGSVSYTAEAGLSLLPGETPALPSPKAEKPPRHYRPYVADTYAQHIKGLHLAYTTHYALGDTLYTPLREEFLYPLRRLCTRLGLDAEEGERLMRLAFALHDVGKLNRPWQSWAADWQTHFAANGGHATLTAEDGPLAHTDYDKNQHDAIKQTFRHAPRGPHAVESAEACFNVILHATKGNEIWLDVILTCIAHHHTPDARESGAFEIVQGWNVAVEAALMICKIDAETTTWMSLISQRFKRTSDDLADSLQRMKPHRDTFKPFLLYLLFVRILRLADQRSTEILGLPKF